MEFVHLKDVEDRKIMHSLSAVFVLGFKVILASLLSSNIQNEVTTLSVLDSEDDDNNLMDCPPSNTRLVKT